METIIKRKTKSGRSSKHIRQLSKLKRKFLEYYAKLPIQKLAAEFIGKDEDTITNWKKKDKKFSDRLGMAKSEWALEKASKIKRPEWLLERIMKEHFAEKTEVENSENSELDKTLDRIAKIMDEK